MIVVVNYLGMTITATTANYRDAQNKEPDSKAEEYKDVKQKPKQKYGIYILEYLGGKMTERKLADWQVMDDEHTNDPSIWSWGDWTITKEASGYHLLVSSGASYGPFPTFEAVKQHAEDVRGD